MQYTTVTNPQWANVAHTTINCDVDFAGIGVVPFTANPLDTYNPSSKEIFDRCVAGDFGPVAAYAPPPPYVPTADDNKATAVTLLQATDWTTIADVGNPQMSNPYLANQSAFIAYRNALRNIAVYPVAGDLVWPTAPVAQWVKV